MKNAKMQNKLFAMRFRRTNNNGINFVYDFYKPAPTLANMRIKILPLLLCLTLPLAIGGIGGYATATSVGTWFTTIEKPTWNPPNWIFGPVWTSLYALMGIASYIVWLRRKEVNHFGFVTFVYLFQLLLNLSWSFLFFYAHQIGLAAIEILVLLAFMVCNAYLFYRINKWAGLLYLPYVLWVSFASLLNFSIWQLNS